MNAQSLAIIVVSTIGFAKLIANFVNWMCSFRIAKQIVVADKMLNMFLVACYPVVLAWVLTSGSSNPSASPFGGTQAQILECIGLFGLLLLIRSTVAYWSYAPPACEVSDESMLVDFRKLNAQWKLELIDPQGKSHQIAAMPANEQFLLEVSTKTYVLPQLPAEWDGLSIVHLSDFHFIGGLSRRYFELVCEQAESLKPDIFAFTGDLLDDPQFVDWFPTTLGKLSAPKGLYYVLGNHDWYNEPNQTRATFQQHGWTDLASRFVQLPGENAIGSPITLCGDETPWMGTHPNLADAPQNSFRILLSHTPDNIRWARANRIHLMLAGHTHGGQIRLPILGPIYSPSRYGVRFASGVFWLEPTLLYVTRGISGKEPVRYNCSPELTKIVLKRKA